MVKYINNTTAQAMVNGFKSKFGNNSALKTTSKNFVGAINELKLAIANLPQPQPTTLHTAINNNDIVTDHIDNEHILYDSIYGNILPDYLIIKDSTSGTLSVVIDENTIVDTGCTHINRDEIKKLTNPVTDDTSTFIRCGNSTGDDVYLYIVRSDGTIIKSKYKSNERNDFSEQITSGDIPLRPQFLYYDNDGILRTGLRKIGTGAAIVEYFSTDDGETFHARYYSINVGDRQAGTVPVISVLYGNAGEVLETATVNDGYPFNIGTYAINAYIPNENVMYYVLKGTSSNGYCYYISYDHGKTFELTLTEPQTDYTSFTFNSHKYKINNDNLVDSNNNNVLISDLSGISGKYAGALVIELTSTSALVLYENYLLYINESNNIYRKIDETEVGTLPENIPQGISLSTIYGRIHNDSGAVIKYNNKIYLWVYYGDYRMYAHMLEFEYNNNNVTFIKMYYNDQFRQNAVSSMNECLNGVNEHFLTVTANGYEYNANSDGSWRFPAIGRYTFGSGALYIINNIPVMLILPVLDGYAMSMYADLYTFSTDFGQTWKCVRFNCDIKCIQELKDRIIIALTDDTIQEIKIDQSSQLA